MPIASGDGPKKPSIRLSAVTTLVTVAGAHGTVLTVSTGAGSTEFVIPKKSPDDVALKANRFLAGWTPLAVVVGERTWAAPDPLPALTGAAPGYRPPSQEIATMVLIAVVFIVIVI